MRYAIVLLWSLILGQVVAFLGSTLSHTLYSFEQGLMGSVLLAVVVCLVAVVSKPTTKQATK
ncbi:YjzD family protein [Vagococcus sp. PNs007]|uniref:DUF2929 domain-containing protein n=2 Tax=Vagococcus TaxID=2737 RepID=A0A430AC91_9ENTE|nr:MULTISPECIES: DUF2929 family protein [Vagococcus]MDF0479098.1 YjzD family protein [Vagococcus proximus]RSU04831.1 hypothetical protein CBF31_02090 [Vagococcus fessus]